MENNPLLLEMVNISKRYPGVQANDSVNFDVKQGEIHALLGENGAGKTTLMNILYGLTSLDIGKIFLHGQEVKINSPIDAIRLGIGMIHQHFMLIESFDVLENVILGQRVSGYPFLDSEKELVKVKKIIEEYRFQLNPRTLISQLSVGQQQRVEIVKALYRGADLLIMDEPTAVLTPSEVDDLSHLLDNLRKAGHGIIFISHKLSETIDFSDRVTVLRNGRVVNTLPTNTTSKPELAQLMVGRNILFEQKHSTYQGEKSTILNIESLCVNNDLGLEAVHSLLFQVHAGEIFGIAGVDGNGQKELVEAVTGLRPVKKGAVSIDGKDVTGSSPNQINNLNVAYIPEDRQRRGLVMPFKIGENIVIKNVEKPPFTRNGVLQKKVIRNHAQKLAENFDVRPPIPEMKTSQLSGGNQQKVVLARELSKNPRLIIAAQPTRGLDVGATEYVHKKLLEAASEGSAVLLVSTELDEVLGLSDTIAVIYNGHIVGQMTGSEINLERIGLLMGGIKVD